jgi:hypothetical protein
MNARGTIDITTSIITGEEVILLPKRRAFDPVEGKMKRRDIAGPPLLCLATVLCLATLSLDVSAQEFRFQWGARLSVAEQYDDNIAFSDDDTEYDWITLIRPGLTLSLIRDEVEANLLYEFSLVKYARFDERSTTRHRLTLTAPGIAVTERLTLDLDNAFLISEDPLGREAEENVPSVRSGRGRYYSNVFDGRFNFLFGAEDLFYVGFAHIFLDNEDPQFEDSQRIRPSAGLEYWFNARYGISTHYSYGKAEFDLSDDYQTHLGIATFNYRFNPRTETNLSYSYDKLDYVGPRVGYDVHQITLGLDHEFSTQTTGSITGGYYVVVPEEGDNRGKPTGSLSLTHTSSRSTFTLDGAAGYRRQDIQAENFGLSFFASAAVSFTYQLLERLSAMLTGAYFRDEFQETIEERVDTNWRGTVALDYLLLRWLTGSARYEYRQRDSSIEADEYVDNRVTINLRATYSGMPRPF